jgi:Domain of unknown function (DUF4386)
MERMIQAAPRLTARIAGALYLFIFITAPSGASTATPLRMVATLTCDTGVALIFYYLFKPASRRLSFLATVFRLIFVAVMTANSLNYFGVMNPFNDAHSARAFNYVYGVTLVPFGVHCLLVGYLIFGSTFLPRMLGVLLALAGLGYLTFRNPGTHCGIQLVAKCAKGEHLAQLLGGWLCWAESSLEPAPSAAVGFEAVSFFALSAFCLQIACWPPGIAAHIVNASAASE